MSTLVYRVPVATSFVLVALGGAAGLARAQPSWGHPRVVETTTGVYSTALNNTSVCQRDDLGATHIVFSDSAQPSIVRYLELTGTGPTITVRDIQPITAGAEVRAATLSFLPGNTGYAAAAWIEKAGGTDSLVVARSTNRGATWQRRAVIATGAAGSIASPSLSTSWRVAVPSADVCYGTPSGVSCSAWQGTTWTSGSWSTPAAIPGAGAGWGNVAVAGHGGAAIAAFDDGHEVWVSTRATPGGAWSTGVRAGLGGSNDPSLAILPTGGAPTIYLGYHDLGTLYLAKSTTGGPPFTPVTANGGNFGQGLFAHVALDPTGTEVAVAYEQKNAPTVAGPPAVMFSTDGMGSATPLPFTALADALQPAACMRDHVIDVFWLQGATAGPNADVLVHLVGTY